MNHVKTNIIPVSNQYNPVLPGNDYFTNITNETLPNYEENKRSIKERIEKNKEPLLKLLEGALDEGVRRGANILHIRPVNDHEMDINFIINGKINLWRRLKGASPEEMISVVKNISRGLDSPEWLQRREGFFQKSIEGIKIRFKISILTVSSPGIIHKFENILISILDDRKVIFNFFQLNSMPTYFNLNSETPVPDPPDF